MNESKRILDGEERHTHLTASITTLINEIERGELLIDEICQPTILKFVKRWSELEKTRLALIGMTLDVDARDERLRLEGQFNGVVVFGESPEMIQEAIDENRVLLQEARNELFDLNEKLAKLRSKR